MEFSRHYLLVAGFTLAGLSLGAGTCAAEKGNAFFERGYATARFEGKSDSTVLDTIGGGTSEVQKNIIARRGLGQPKSF